MAEGGEQEPGGGDGGDDQEVGGMDGGEVRLIPLESVFGLLPDLPCFAMKKDEGTCSERREGGQSSTGGDEANIGGEWESTNRSIKRIFLVLTHYTPQNEVEEVSG